MSYFKNFPVIYYTLDDRKSTNLIQDILRRIVVDKSLIDNASLFDEYDMKEGETLESVADRFYKNPNMYWVVALCNDIYDARFDVVQDYNAFEKFIRTKYPSNVYLQENRANAFYLNEVITGLDSGATAKVYSNTKAAATLQYIKLQGAFEGGEEIKGYISNTKANIVVTNPHVYDTRSDVHHYELSNSIIVTQAVYTASSDLKKKEVTNYDYEVTLQENKRRLRILKPEYASYLVTEFDKKIVA